MRAATRRSAARRARARSRRARPRARGAGGGRRTRRRNAASTAPSRPAGWSTSCTRFSPVRTTMVELREEEREIARAEVQAVHAVAADGEYRDELARALAAVDEASLEDDDAGTLERVLELGLQT